MESLTSSDFNLVTLFSISYHTAGIASKHILRITGQVIYHKRHIGSSQIGRQSFYNHPTIVTGKHKVTIFTLQGFCSKQY